MKQLGLSACGSNFGPFLSFPGSNSNFLVHFPSEPNRGRLLHTKLHQNLLLQGWCLIRSSVTLRSLPRSTFSALVAEKRRIERNAETTTANMCDWNRKGDGGLWSRRGTCPPHSSWISEWFSLHWHRGHEGLYKSVTTVCRQWSKPLFLSPLRCSFYFYLNDWRCFEVMKGRDSGRGARGSEKQ